MLNRNMYYGKYGIQYIYLRTHTHTQKSVRTKVVDDYKTQYMLNEKNL